MNPVTPRRVFYLVHVRFAVYANLLGRSLLRKHLKEELTFFDLQNLLHGQGQYSLIGRPGWPCIGEDYEGRGGVALRWGPRHAAATGCMTATCLAPSNPTSRSRSHWSSCARPRQWPSDGQACPASTVLVLLSLGATPCHSGACSISCA